MRNPSRNDILKIIAMVTMLIDHMGVLLFPELRILRTIGRIAFPIFAYQLALGFKYTKDRKKYRKTLLIFGLISQIPYMFLDVNLEADFFVFNVILLFWFATFALEYFEKAIKSVKRDVDFVKGFFFILLGSLLVLLPDIASIIFDGFSLSYGTYGMMLIVMFYLANQNTIKIIVGFLVVTYIGTMMSGMVALHDYYEMSYTSLFFNLHLVWDFVSNYRDGLRTLEVFFFQARSVMAIPLIIILEYLKPKFRINKKIGYYFYPVHIAILVLLNLLIFGT